MNEPNKLGDISSYARPGKYVGIWWEMHLNRSTWGSGPKHGATTANTKRYIDFAAKHGFSGVLVEGWNTGWDGDWIANGAGFSFTQAYPDFDLARSHVVCAEQRRLADRPQRDGRRDCELRVADGGGLRAVRKARRPYGEDRLCEATTARFNGSRPTAQSQTNGSRASTWCAIINSSPRAAAKYHIAIDAHEPVKDTGLRRTYPNMMTREGARGQEFNAWGDPTNPPEHMTILPFTRLLAGPMDFTPGVFDITAGKKDLRKRVQSTLAKQLALYVVLYSPIQMAADLPENYEAHPDAFQFIRDVPTDWERSRTLDARIGDYIVVARQQRNGEDWYLGRADGRAAALGVGGAGFPAARPQLSG